MQSKPMSYTTVLSFVCTLLTIHFSLLSLKETCFSSPRFLLWFQLSQWVHTGTLVNTSCVCAISSAGFTFARALGQDEIWGPQHWLRKIFNLGELEQLRVKKVDGAFARGAHGGPGARTFLSWFQPPLDLGPNWPCGKSGIGYKYIVACLGSTSSSKHCVCQNLLFI